MTAWTYILECADGSYYIGTTRATLEARIAQHDAGTLGGYTASRRPVQLRWAEEFSSIQDAIAAERKLKGWSRAKKSALIRGDVEALPRLAARRKPFRPCPEEVQSTLSTDEEARSL